MHIFCCVSLREDTESAAYEDLYLPVEFKPFLIQIRLSADMLLDFGETEKLIWTFSGVLFFVCFLVGLKTPEHGDVLSISLDPFLVGYNCLTVCYSWCQGDIKVSFENCFLEHSKNVAKRNDPNSQ